MQINHNIRAMVTQHALYQNNNAMGKSLEKLSTGLRINRAQDDAAGLAMSEQMRSQIRGLGKAKQNAGDGICALQIAEGALAEITNMMQRQKELAVQAANDTLTSTERLYLDDEFQALTKEIDRIAKTTDYNGKNVLIFDQDPNLSFGATKLNPYNRNISFMEASKELYNTFGAKLNSGLGLVGGDGMSNQDIRDAEAVLNQATKDLIEPQANVDAIQAEINRLRSLNNNSGAYTGPDPFTASPSVSVAVPGPTNSDAINQLTAAMTAGGAYGNALDTAKSDVNAARSDLNAERALLDPSIKDINDAISKINKVITDLNGIPLSEGNIKEILSSILLVGDVEVGDPLADPRPTLGGDSVFANVLKAFEDGLVDLVEGSDKQAILNANLFLRDVKDAYEAYQAAEVGDPRFGDDGDILKASQRDMLDTLNRLFSSDSEDIIVDHTADPLQVDNMLATGNYSMLANTANMVIDRLNKLADGGGYIAPSGPLSDEGIAALGAMFSRTASPQLRDAVATIMQFDVSKMTNSAGNPLPWDNADKQIAMALQKTVGELSEAFGNYADELAYPVGTAASEILHISANYSRSLGGKDASEIFVNYVAIDVKGLGMHAQSIDEQANATRAIDQVDDVLKVISGNRASIGTYINRLEYTINNIASMEYNTQDAESRIRDTDFATVTTDFTRNQIMVQSATSILAQANTLPQAVLGLLG